MGEPWRDITDEVRAAAEREDVADEELYAGPVEPWQ